MAVWYGIPAGSKPRVRQWKMPFHSLFEPKHILGSEGQNVRQPLVVLFALLRGSI